MCVCVCGPSQVETPASGPATGGQAGIKLVIAYSEQLFEGSESKVSVPLGQASHGSGATGIGMSKNSNNALATELSIVYPPRV